MRLNKCANQSRLNPQKCQVVQGNILRKEIVYIKYYYYYYYYY